MTDDHDEILQLRRLNYEGVILRDADEGMRKFKIGPYAERRSDLDEMTEAHERYLRRRGSVRKYLTRDFTIETTRRNGF